MPTALPSLPTEELGDPLFQAIFENSAIGVLVGTLDGRILRANPACEKLFGYAPEELVGLSLLQFTDPTDTATDLALFQQLVEGKRTSYQLDKRYIHRHGWVFWGHLTVSLVRTPEGSPRYAIAMVQDLSERRAAEAALRLSEERYELAARAGRVGVWDLDLRSNRLYLAPNLKAMLGYSDEELASDLVAWCQIVHPDDKERVLAATAAHLEGETEVYEVEVRRRHKDGHYLWCLARGTAERDEQGNLIRMTGSDTDITEQKRSQEQLRESEERLRLALDAGHCGIWDWDIATNRIHWSDRVHELYGMEPGTFSGRFEDFSQLIHPEDIERLRAALQPALSDGVPYQVDYRIRRPQTGEMRWLATRGRVLRDQNNQPYRMLGAVIDMTDRIQTEKALRKANEELAAARGPGSSGQSGPECFPSPHEP